MKTRKILKKTLAVVLTVMMVAASMSILAVGATEAAAAPEPTKNWGKSADGNYHITSLADMLAFMSDDVAALTEPAFYEGATVVLDADIDMSSVPNKRMTQFSGIFEGNGHAIKNLTADNLKVRTGFIDTLKNATIKNVRFVGGDLKTETNRSGVVASTAQGNVILENIYVNTPIANGVANNVDGGYHVGGLIGSINLDNSEVTIKNCMVESSLESNFMVGGLIGSLEKKCTLNIADSVVTGSVISKSVTAGTTDSITLRRSAGLVGHIAGGLAGYNITFTRCIMEGISTGSDGNGAFVTLRNPDGPNLKFEDCYVALDDANRNIIGNYKGSGVYNIEIKYNGTSVYNKQSAGNGDAADINAAFKTIAKAGVASADKANFATVCQGFTDWTATDDMVSYGTNMTVVKVMPTSVNSMLAGTFAVVIPPSAADDNNQGEGEGTETTEPDDTDAKEPEATESKSTGTTTATDAATDTDAADSGCGSAIGVTSMVLVAVGACVATVFNKKRED